MADKQKKNQILQRKLMERRIQEVEIGEALKRMKGGKSMGPDGIPIEVWR